MDLDTCKWSSRGEGSLLWSAAFIIKSLNSGSTRCLWRISVEYLVLQKYIFLKLVSDFMAGMLIFWFCSSGRQAARLFSMPHLVQQETTLAYLENQIAAALMLQSSHEYRHWLLIYARYLVNEGETWHAVLLLCSSHGLLRNALFTSCICMIALNILLLALGFRTQCLLKTKTNCWSTFASYSAQYSGILFWHTDCEQIMVWGNSAICGLQL